MLRPFHSLSSRAGLAFAVPAALLILVPATEDASAKGFRFSTPRSHTENASASSPNRAKHAEEEAGEGEAAGGFKVHMRNGASAEEKAAEAKKSELEKLANEEAEKANASAKSAPDGSVPGLENAETKPSEQPAPQQAQAASPPSPTPAKAVATPAVHKQHSLAEAHPGMDVVVCEAGCPSANEQPFVAYAQPTTKAEVKSSGAMTPTAASDATAAANQMIRCEGGCYDTPKAYRSAQMTGEAGTGSWLPAVVPAGSGPAKGSGEWMRRIDATRPTEVPAKK
jgi:hypothetical protein